MSLNGLDLPEVQQAYQATLSEAAGWLLVKYISRDEIALLGRGLAGLGEARAAILQYEDLSPLYGLVVYRRRKVLVKYVPEGTSRLLQARTTVHLRDVQDKWAPYETMLEIATADGLNDTALAAAFPLHTASPALSSNQLNEITEDTEDNEESNAVPERLTHSPSTSSVSSRRPTIEKRPPSQRSYRSPSFTSVPFAGDHSPVLKHKSSLSQFLVREELGHKSVTQLNAYSTIEDTASIKDDTASITSTRTEIAIPSAAPAARKNTNESADYDLERYLDTFFKPKIKLGPRPVNVTEKGKRTTAAAPVSSLPAGVQFRSKQPLWHPQPQYPVVTNRLADHAPSNTTAPPRLPSLHFSPQIPDIPEFLPPRPNSRGSSRSLPAPRASKAYLTPEKQRLMKALEMRKKQMRNSTSVESMSRLPASDAASPTVVDFTHNQVPAAQQAIGANKADSGIDIAHASAAKEVMVSSLLQDELKPVNEAPMESSDANLDKEQADTLPENTPSMSEVNEEAAFVDRPKMIMATLLPNTTGTVLKEGPIEQSSDHEQEHIIAHGPAAPLEVSNDSLQGDNAMLGKSEKISKMHAPTNDNIPKARAEIEVQASIPDLSTENAQENDSIEPELEAGSEDPQKKRRRGMLEPLQIQARLERHSSEHKFLSDDDFMDELQTATFEQATPVAMSKSPASPFFPPRRPSSRSAKSSNSTTTAVSTEVVPLVPSVSNTLEKRQIAPELLLPSSEPLSLVPTRTPSVSSVRTTESVGLGRKSNVSSGISARIAALAESSSRDGSPPIAPGSRKLSASSTIAQRKSSYIDQSTENQAVAGAERRPVGKLAAWRAAAPSDTSYLKTSNAQSSNRDSVSVTARIVRVPRAGQPAAPTELQASPLLFNHQRPAQPNKPALPPVATSNLPSKPTEGEHDSVMSPHSRDGMASRGSVETSATGRRKSFDRKSFKSFGTPTSPKKNALKQSATMPPLENSPDKTSRTSRFFKRISHLGKDKKKNMPLVPTITTTPSEPMSPTSTTRSGPTGPAATVSIVEPLPQPKAELPPVPVVTPIPAVTSLSESKPRPDSIADTPPPVSIGDFNVQFPDTLLWKRRWIEIDSTGHLMFTAAARHSNINKTFNSKFHLKEIGAPFVPDIDRQEMPHSVICDLVSAEGSIQFASEDAMSQRQLLSLLTTYHQAWKTV